MPPLAVDPHPSPTTTPWTTANSTSFLFRRGITRNWARFGRFQADSGRTRSMSDLCVTSVELGPKLTRFGPALDRMRRSLRGNWFTPPRRREAKHVSNKKSPETPSQTYMSKQRSPDRPCAGTRKTNSQKDGNDLFLPCLTVSFCVSRTGRLRRPILRAMFRRNSLGGRGGVACDLLFDVSFRRGIAGDPLLDQVCVSECDESQTPSPGIPLSWHLGPARASRRGALRSAGIGGRH